ncbi:MAG TPA: hypothetical protein ENH85_06400 [Candidatus Scalindua sp.]|nr:hypothetical protein [Candidatus Scalindua sp.]
MDTNEDIKDGSEIIKDSGDIIIDEKTQEMVRNIRLEIVRLQDVLNKVLITVYNMSGKEGDYQPNDRFTKLELVKDFKAKR